jgi:hypothetical protein
MLVGEAARGGLARGEEDMETVTDKAMSGDPGTELAPKGRAEATCRYCGGRLLDATPESGYTGSGPDWASWGSIAGTVVGFDWGCSDDSNPDVYYDDAEECWTNGSHLPDADGIEWPAEPWGPNSQEPVRPTAPTTADVAEALYHARRWLETFEFDPERPSGGIGVMAAFIVAEHGA